MKFISLVILAVTGATGWAQGTLVYDQQSSTNETTLAGNGPIQSLSPIGQSFTPSLSSVAFVKLKLNDRFPGNSLGATLLMNLRAGSLSGPILGSTDPIFLPDGFSGVTNFLFQTSIPVTPATTYLFEPVVQSGDTWNIDGEEFNYPGGMAYYNGVAFSGSDLWFREGVIVPEPSSSLLLVAGNLCRSVCGEEAKLLQTNLSLRFVGLLTGLATFVVSGQGTFVFDQQSSTDEVTLSGNTTIQQLQVPYGQSFTPTLPSIAFVKLKLNDRFPGNGLGATLYINLHSGSIGGPVVGSTDPILLSNAFAGVTNFLFPTAISITPNATYFFEPVVQSGDLWNLDAEEYNYAGGTAFYAGAPLPGSDYWFREGVIVPEPSSSLLLVTGTCAVLYAARRRNWFGKA